MKIINMGGNLMIPRIYIASPDALRDLFESRDLRKISEDTGISLSTLKNYLYGRTEFEDMPISMARRLTEILSDGWSKLLPGKYVVDEKSWARLVRMRKFRYEDIDIRAELHSAINISQSGKAILIDFEKLGYDSENRLMTGLDIDDVFDTFVLAGNSIFIRAQTDKQRYSKRLPQLDIAPSNEEVVLACTIMRHLIDSQTHTFLDDSVDATIIIEHIRRVVNGTDFDTSFEQQFPQIISGPKYTVGDVGNWYRNVFGPDGRGLTSSTTIHFATYPKFDSKEFLTYYLDSLGMSVNGRRRMMELVNELDATSCQDFVDKSQNITNKLQGVMCDHLKDVIESRENK